MQTIAEMARALDEAERRYRDVVSRNPTADADAATMEALGALPSRILMAPPASPADIITQLYVFQTDSPHLSDLRDPVDGDNFRMLIRRIEAAFNVEASYVFTSWGQPFEECADKAPVQEAVALH